jgi:hypothetical protein
MDNACRLSTATRYDEFVKGVGSRRREVEHPLCIESTPEPNLEPRNRRSRVRPTRVGEREALSVEAGTK